MVQDTRAEHAQWAAWASGGWGLRLAPPDSDPVWFARDDRPLVLLRRTAGGVSEERFAFDSLALIDAELTAHADVVDSAGARWVIRLRASAKDNGYVGSLRWTLLSGPAAGVFVGHRLTLLADPADLYVCLPGSVYDGNDITPVHKDIPRVSRTGVLDVPTTSLASPCAAFHARSACVSLVVGGAQHGRKTVALKGASR